MFTGQFTMQVLSAFVMGFIIAFPYVFWEIWRFVKPGLHLNERKNSGVLYLPYRPLSARRFIRLYFYTHADDDLVLFYLLHQ